MAVRYENLNEEGKELVVNLTKGRDEFPEGVDFHKFFEKFKIKG